LTGVEHHSITGTIKEIRARIGSDGKDVVEIFLKTSAGEHRAIAHANQASAAINLKEKMEKLATSNGVGSIGELGVNLVVDGLVKDPSTTTITALRLAS
jgi:hypothetical protein